MTVRRQERRDTSANWAASAVPLLQGEIGIEVDGNGKPIGMRVGDGTSLWGALTAPGTAALGQYVPAGWGAWWKARRTLAASSSALVSVAAVTDSVGWGAYTSNLRTKSYPMLIATALQTLYGDGGSGFQGAAFSSVFALGAGVPSGAVTAWQATSPVSIWGSTGTWTVFDEVGPGSVAITAGTVGATQTIGGLRGTTIKIYTLSNGGGNAAWTYNIDGAGAVGVTDGAGATVQTTTITGLSNTTHTVVISQNGSGKTLYLLGARAQNATGVVVDAYSRAGQTAGGYSASVGQFGFPGPSDWSGGPSNPCDLLLYELGANDINVTQASGATLNGSPSFAATSIAITSGPVPPGRYVINGQAVGIWYSTSTTAYLTTPVDWSATTGTALLKVTSAEQIAGSVGKHLSFVRQGSTNPPDVLMVSPHIGTFDTSNSWPGVTAQLRGVAESFGAAYMDMWPAGKNSWTYWNGLSYWGNSASLGAAGTDPIHLSDAGAAAYANALLPILKAT